MTQDPTMPPPMPPSNMPPPPSGGTPGGNPIPWEDRDRLGFGNALMENIKLFVTNPREAFRRTQRSGDLASPLIYGVIIMSIGIIIGQIWQLMLGNSLTSFLPEDIQGQVAGAAAGGVMGIIFAPIYSVIGLFIAAGIFHLCLMITGGVKESDAGFEGTFRGVAYASVSQLAAIIPVVGGLISLFWGIYLYVLGFSTIHRTTEGKALVAVLIPIGLCCLCGILAVIGLAGTIAGLAGASG